jgi:integrase
MAVLAECPFCHRRQTAISKKCSSNTGKGCGADLVKAKRSGKVHYWITYRLPGGKQRFEKLTGENACSIEYAKAADAKRKVQKKENRILDIKPEAKMTFQELSDWYLGLEKVKAMAYFPTLQVYLKKFNAEFGNVIVNRIKAADLENLQARRKAEGMADSTVDQEIAAARVVINKGFDNDLVGGDTLKAFKKVKKLLKRNANARDKIITPDQLQALLDSAPSHLLAILAAGFYTGMRKGEILDLIWPKVDMKNRVIRLEAEDTKDRESRTIPICQERFDLLRTIPKAVHDDHVFLYKGQPIRDIRTGLEKACRAAGIDYGRKAEDGFVFHDLRHCFNTYMRKAGVSESVIMRITGHSTREMFDRYNRIDEQDMRNAVAQMRTFLASVDQNVDQTPQMVSET